MTRLFVMMMMVLLGIAAVWAQHDSAAQQRVAQEYLRAHLLADYDTLRNALPTDKAEMFGPYLFGNSLKIGVAKVDEQQALVEFTGKVEDARFPRKGAFLMRQRDGVWYVRQVYFYNSIPAIFRLPSRSVTRIDRANEPRALAVAKRFASAWEKDERTTMLSNWYDWTKRDKEPIKGLSMSKTSITMGTTTWRDGFASYSTVLTYRFGPLRYSMDVKGGFPMFQDKGAWKVRGNIVVFDF